MSMHHPSRPARVTGHVELRRGKRGASWFAKYRLPEAGGTRQYMRRLGPAWLGKGRPPDGHLTRNMAEEALAALLTDARRGTLEATTKTSGVTFGDATAEWLRYVEHDRRRRASTVRNYRYMVERRFLKEFGAETPIELVTGDVIEAWRARAVADGKLSARTINKQLAALHGVFERARRVWKIPLNPVAAVDRQPVKASGDIAVYSAVEVEALARAASSDQDAALFRVAAYTGLRLGELRALRWADVSFANRTILVRRSYTYGTLSAPKSGKVRSVPLVDQAAAALENLSRRDRFTDEDDLVFPNDVGEYIDESALRRRYKDAIAAAKLRPLRFHDLRHSFGTLAAAVFPLADVQAYMGHAHLATTAIYLHHVPRIDAAEKLSRAFAGSDDFVSPAVSRTAEFEQNREKLEAA